LVDIGLVTHTAIRWDLLCKPVDRCNIVKRVVVVCCRLVVQDAPLI